MSSLDSFTMLTPDTTSEASGLARQVERQLMLESVGEVPSSTALGAIGLDLRSLDQGDGTILISTSQPQRPEGSIEHVPCDIVLVIDVSGSMAAAAPLPDVSDSNARESSGLTILDLTKHAARTILETLNIGDRLGIVTFDNTPRVVQELSNVSDEVKDDLRTKIKTLRPGSSTNLWGGIRNGLNLFKDDSSNVQGLFVLTDGMPNYMCPPQGYVPKLKPILDEMARSRDRIPSIHTFGFGYNIRSGLMQSIAEAGSGSYAFIPDAGMIGTVFVHAIANLFSTYAVSAKLTLETVRDTKIRYAAGIPLVSNEWGDITLDLGNLQYGQPRDIVVHLENFESRNAILNAKLVCRLPDGRVQAAKSSISVGDESSSISKSLAQYHWYRHELMTILNSLFPLRQDGEHIPISLQDGFGLSQRAKLAELCKEIDVCSNASDPNIKSLRDDIMSNGSAGQVMLALETQDKQSYWTKWGQHYLPSLLHAHMRQMCNTFKDPGPLRYGLDNSLFIACRDRLDAMFDSLPPPEPTAPQRVGAHSQRFVGSMRRFNSSSNPCFDGDCHIQCADGSIKIISHLSVGQHVWTPAGSRQVHAIVKTDVDPTPMCRIGKLWITPWHPIQDHYGRWGFPVASADEVALRSCSVFSILLEPGQDPQGHAVRVERQVCVTLGHGVVDSKVAFDDPRCHSFLGDYAQIVSSLQNLDANKKGHLLCAGIERDPATSLARGFLRHSTSKPTRPERAPLGSGRIVEYFVH